MNPDVLANTIAFWLTVNAKGGVVYVAARLADGVVGARRPAWRSWLWLMVILSFPVLSLLEWMGGAAPWLGRAVAGMSPALLLVAVHGYALVAIVLIGLVVAAGVRLALVRRHSPSLDVELAPSGNRVQAFGPVLRLLRRVDVRSSELQSVPTTFGLLYPSVVLPSAVEGLAFRDLARVAVTHAFVAILRFDAWWMLAARLVQCVYFLNPVVWWAAARFRRAAEQARDEWTAYGLGDADGYRESRARVAVQAARPGWMSVDVPMMTGRGAVVAGPFPSHVGSSDCRPDRIGRWPLLGAVVAALAGLAVLGSLRLTDGGPARVGAALDPSALAAGVGLAVVAGGVLVAAGAGRRRSGQAGVAESEASGVYRRTVADCVERLEREWRDVQPLVGLAGRVLGPLVLAALVVMLLTCVLWQVTGWPVASHPPYYVK